MRYIYQQNTLANTHDVKVKLPQETTAEKPISKQEWADKYNAKAPLHITYYINKKGAL